MRAPSTHRAYRLREQRAPGFTDEDERFVAERRARILALDQAVARLPGDDPVTALQRVAVELPAAISVETVAIRIRDNGPQGLLHLLAFDGSPVRELHKLALAPLTVYAARTILALGAHHSEARALGLRWLAGEWLRHGEDVVGVVTFGSRTERRPNEDDRAVARRVAAELAARLAAVDRSAATLVRQTRRVVRDAALSGGPEPMDGVLGALRPREQTIIDLYADGLAAREIADLLVISPHTVRTHIKHAFRRLGVHSREEAARIVQEDRVLKLV